MNLEKFPEKAQPVKNVEVPKAVPATISVSSLINSEDKAQSVTDAPVILDTNSKRIESIARIKKPGTLKTLVRILTYLRRHWFLLILSILFAGINSVFEIFIPLLIGKGIDHIIGPKEVNFEMVGKGCK